MNLKCQIRFQCEVGEIFLVASGKGLSGIHWTKQNAPEIKELSEGGKASPHLSKAIQQLREYFLGLRQNFDVTLDLVGTDFQKKVWMELSKIPYGETCSYQEIAERIQNIKAVRAVGAANGKNPVSILVPCHRVIGQSGQLTGYAGGLKRKKHLLDLERKSSERKSREQLSLEIPSAGESLDFDSLG